jgi:hypothetical protein
MVHHGEESSGCQDVLTRLHQLRQGQGKFMPCHGFFRVGIEPAAAHGTIGGVTDYGAKRTNGKETPGTAGIGPDNINLLFQTIAKDILACYSHQRALQLQTDYTCLWEAACQKQGYHSTTSAQIEQRGGGSGRDKIRQQKGV